MTNTNQLFQTRCYAAAVALHGSAGIELGGRVFTPDETKAYAEVRLCHGFPVITAYGTHFHPGTVANSFASLEGQMVNYDHKLKIHSTDKNEIREDQIMGYVAGVEFPNAPAGGWKMGLDKAASPGIRAVLGIFKNARQTKGVLGEHLSGRHKWAVSIECGWNLLESGFVVGDLDKATAGQKAILAQQVPTELEGTGMGYVTVESAPAELVDCFDLNKKRITATWGKLPVTLAMGGLNGRVHFMGVGIVRYGAEREAAIQQILASDPDALTADAAPDYFTGVITGLERALGLLKN